MLRRREREREKEGEGLDPGLEHRKKARKRRLSLVSTGSLAVVLNLPSWVGPFDLSKMSRGVAFVWLKGAKISAGRGSFWGSLY
jgi:hypothetical protein